MSDNPTVICYAKRTAIGKMSGALAQTPAPMLGAALVKDALQKTGLDAGEVDEIIMGQVLTAGVGQAPARQAAIYGGLAKSVCATTINRVCGSGLKAVMLADQAIRLGEAKIVMAGGQENMTLAPHILPGSRAGYRFGGFEAKDTMQFDGLWDPYNNMPMGNCGEVCAKEYKFSREEQDAFAMESYRRARAATESGFFKNEIVPFEIQDRKQTKIFDKDEEPFSVELDRLPTLRPAFDRDGTVTAGNASSINDGASLTVLTDLKTAQSKGLKPIAKILSQASFAQDPVWFTTAPVEAMRRAAAKASLKMSDIGLFEINEAFAVVTMAAMRDLSLKAENVNPYGGAVALGHPIGCSGNRILVTLLNGMQERGERYGMAAICIGGGEASAVVVERI